MTATLTIDSREPLRLAEQLRQQKAAQSAADRAAKSARSKMTQAIRRAARVKSRDIRPRIRLPGARIRPVKVEFRVEAEPMPLILFRARQLKRAGVKAEVQGRTKTFRGAFIATMPSGHEGVFRRRKETRSRAGLPRGSPQLPIRQMFGASAAQLFGDHWEDVGLARFRERFPLELFRALRFRRRGRRR